MELTQKAASAEVSSLRAWYSASIENFLAGSADTIFAELAKWIDFDISSRLTDTEYAADKALERISQCLDKYLDDCLHLAVSVRSFRAENVAAFVKALLDCEKNKLARLLPDYQIVGPSPSRE